VRRKREIQGESKREKNALKRKRSIARGTAPEEQNEGVEPQERRVEHLDTKTLIEPWETVPEESLRKNVRLEGQRTSVRPGTQKNHQAAGLSVPSAQKKNARGWKGGRKIPIPTSRGRPPQV